MFGDSRERNDQGWLIYPSDVTYRSKYFVHWSEALEADHPAKANLFLTEDLILHVTEPGQRVMDVNSGSGSILIGAVHGRSVTSIDIAPHFVKWQLMSLARMIESGQTVSKLNHFILEGNCTDLLPMPADAVVFSPPYSKAMQADTKGGVYKDNPQLVKMIEQYRHDPKNLGNLDNFLYNRAMTVVYQKIFDSLPSGGKLCLLIKDRISGGKRVDLGRPAVNIMGKIGFTVFEWHRWHTPGSFFSAIHRSQGHRIVEDEHIIIMEKP